MSLSRREALIRIGGAAGVAAFGHPARRRADRAARAGRKPIRRASSRIRRAIFRGRSPIPTPTSSRTIRRSTRCASATRRFSGCGPAACGAKGPAWNGQGQYLIWSDIPNNRQMRWIEDDGRVTVFRQPSGNSNGNTFDHQGRQLSCEHSGRRVVRYEHDGSITVIADSFQGKRLNSPNDIACHPDGSYWFTDPPYGGQLYEGMPDVGGRSEQSGGTPEREGRAAGGIGRAEARAELQRVSRRSERPHRHGDQRRSARRASPTASRFRPTTNGCTSSIAAWCRCSTSSGRPIR